MQCASRKRGRGGYVFTLQNYHSYIFHWWITQVDHHISPSIKVLTRRHSHTHKVPITSLKWDVQKKAWLLRVTKAMGWSLRAMSWPATNLSLELILYNDRVFFFCWATTNWRIKGKRWYYNEHSLSLSLSLLTSQSSDWVSFTSSTQ